MKFSSYLFLKGFKNPILHSYLVVKGWKPELKIRRAVMQNKSEQTKITDRKLWEYSQQLSMLATLLQRKMITQAEYDKIKRRLMRDYKITSDILTWHIP